MTKADKARAFTIARGECVEAYAAIEIASICGATSAGLYAMLTGLVR